MLVVALCGGHHVTASARDDASPPVLVGIGRGLSGLSQRPGEGSVGVF